MGAGMDGMCLGGFLCRPAMRVGRGKRGSFLLMRREGLGYACGNTCRQGEEDLDATHQQFQYKYDEYMSFLP